MSRDLPFRSHGERFHFLLNLLGKDRLPHALLISGPEGIGKALFANHLGRLILCQDENPPCGECAACALLREEKHPDLLKLLPDNQRIKVDAIREVIQNFAFAPLMGKRRVVLIPEAHLLNPAAANALLKTLEEPPNETYFILVTHAPGWLPRTIISRSQVIRLNPLPAQELRKVIDASDAKIDDAVLDEAQGSAGLAIRMAELHRDLPDLEEILQAIERVSADQAYRTAQEVVDREKLESFLDALLCDTRRKLLLLSPGSDLSFDLLCFTDKILEMRRRLKLNINPKMALTRLLLFFREPLNTRLDP